MLKADYPIMDGLTNKPGQRWPARLSFVQVGLAIVVLPVLAGLKSLTMVGVGLAATVVGLAAAYFFLSRRGIGRWVWLVVLVLAAIAVIVVYAFRGLLWVAVLSAAIWLLAGVTARLALAGDLGAGVSSSAVPGPPMSPRQPASPSRQTPTWTALPAATARKRWWLGSPPSTASRSW